jgi:hypothetical protein
MHMLMPQTDEQICTMKPSAVINKLFYAAVNRIGGHDADIIA